MTWRPTLTIVPFLVLTACLFVATQVGAQGFYVAIVPRLGLCHLTALVLHLTQRVATWRVGELLCRRICVFNACIDVYV